MSVVPPLLTLFDSIVNPGVTDVTDVTVLRFASATKSSSLSCAVVTVGSVHCVGVPLKLVCVFTSTGFGCRPWYSNAATLMSHDGVPPCICMTTLPGAAAPVHRHNNNLPHMKPPSVVPKACVTSAQPPGSEVTAGVVVPVAQ